MKCAACGADNPDSARFCELCLAQFQTIPVTPTTTNAEPPDRATQSTYPVGDSPLLGVILGHAAYGLVTAFLLAEPALISGTVVLGVLRSPATLSHEGGIAGVLFGLFALVAIPGFILSMLHLTLALLLGLTVARRPCIVIAAILTVGFPIGTVLGVWTIGSLRQSTIRGLFEHRHLRAVTLRGAARPAIRQLAGTTPHEGRPTLGEALENVPDDMVYDILVSQYEGPSPSQNARRLLLTERWSKYARPPWSMTTWPAALFGLILYCCYEMVAHLGSALRRLRERLQVRDRSGSA